MTSTAINLWSVERLNEHSAFLLHLGYRMFATTPARAFGIAAALNTPEGYAAFTAARDAHNAGEYGSEGADQ